MQRVLLLALVGCLSLGAEALAGRDGRIVVVEHERSDMVRVPGGSFVMGPSEEDREDLESRCRQELGEEHWFCDHLLQSIEFDSREVHVDAFDIDRHEVTSAEYRRCVAAGGCDIEPLVAGDERYLRDAWPMVNVTWHEANDYCAWRGKRLPTEAEWEKAARGTDRRRWPWGNQDRDDGSNHGTGEAWSVLLANGQTGRGQGPTLEFAPDERDGHRHVVAPGTLRWSEGPYGTFDMAGNVSEWTADYFSRQGHADLLRVAPERKVPAPSDNTRVVRGGSWAEPRFFGLTWFPDPMWVFPGGRNHGNHRSPTRGFRCARDVAPGN